MVSFFPLNSENLENLDSDIIKEIAKAYHVLHIDEAIRILDALNFFETHGEVCPANWKEGEKSMQPNQEGLATYFAN